MGIWGGLVGQDGGYVAAALVMLMSPVFFPVLPIIAPVRMPPPLPEAACAALTARSLMSEPSCTGHVRKLCQAVLSASRLTMRLPSRPPTTSHVKPALTDSRPCMYQAPRRRLTPPRPRGAQHLLGGNANGQAFLFRAATHTGVVGLLVAFAAGYAVYGMAVLAASVALKWALVGRMPAGAHKCAAPLLHVPMRAQPTGDAIKGGGGGCWKFRLQMLCWPGGTLGPC